MTQKHYEELKRACAASLSGNNLGFTVEPDCHKLLVFVKPTFDSIEAFSSKKKTYGNLMVLKKLRHDADKLASNVYEFNILRVKTEKMRLFRLRNLRNF